jgi:hypothetical protein
VEYVMVPVPEELAPRVLTFVSWKGAQANSAFAGAEGGETMDVGEAMARAFARFDDASRAVVAVVAAAALDAEELTIPEAARRAGVTTRETLGILMEVNNVIADEGGPAIGFSRTDVNRAAPQEFSWDAYVAAMPEAAAHAFGRLARAHTSG